MADVKISGLPASTVPLAGTEVLPIVQGGATKQVSIANVTAGRSVAALSVITPTIQAEAGSAGGTIKNGSGVAQMQWGSGGASNLSLEVATNINPANAAVNISPTGTGTVTINPATASTMNNVAVGGTIPLAGKFTALEATGVTTLQAGSVSAPALTTTGDTNTGIFFPAADTIAFAEGGAEAMRLFASSGVSIGNTTDPGATNLSVNGVIKIGTKQAVNGPAFSAYPSASQSIATATLTKISFDTELFDTNSNFNTTTYSFTPTIEGYYQVNCTMAFNADVAGTWAIVLQKNGANYLNAGVANFGANYPSASLSCVVSMNGSTDYLEVYIFQNSGSNGVTLAARSDVNQFSASMIRGA